MIGMQGTAAEQPVSDGACFIATVEFDEQHNLHQGVAVALRPGQRVLQQVSRFFAEARLLRAAAAIAQEQRLGAARAFAHRGDGRVNRARLFRGARPVPPRRSRRAALPLPP